MLRKWNLLAKHSYPWFNGKCPISTGYSPPKKTTNSIVPWLLTNGKNAVGYWNGLWLASPHYPFWEQDLWCFLRWCLNSLRVTRTKRNSSVSQLFLYCRRTNLPPTGDKWLCCEFVFVETVDSYPLRPTCINNIQIVLYSSIRLLFSYILYKYSGESWLVPLNGKYSLRDLSDPHAKSLPRFLVFCSWSQTMQRIGGYGGVL